MTTAVREFEDHVEGPLDPGLRLGVEVGGRLVEHNHGRVGQEGTGESDQLTLTGREPATPLPHLGVEPVGQGSIQSSMPISMDTARICRSSASGLA